eukprot:gene466-1872_t
MHCAKIQAVGLKLTEQPADLPSNDPSDFTALVARDESVSWPVMWVESAPLAQGICTAGSCWRWLPSVAPACSALRQYASVAPATEEGKDGNSASRAIPVDPEMQLPLS